MKSFFFLILCFLFYSPLSPAHSRVHTHVTINNGHPIFYPFSGLFTTPILNHPFHCGYAQGSVCRTQRGGACIMQTTYHTNWFGGCVNIPGVHICLNVPPALPTSQPGCYPRGQACTCSQYDSFTGYWYYEFGYVY